MHWRTGSKAKGSEGVAARVQRTANSIGYVEYYYAKNKKTAKGSVADQTTLDTEHPERNLPAAYVQNKSNEFQSPDLETINAALPKDTTGSPVHLGCAMLDSANLGAYPISSLTWLLVHKPIPDQIKPVVCSLLDYGLTPNKDGRPAPGQIDAQELGYVPLPKELIDRNSQTLEQICR